MTKREKALKKIWNIITTQENIKEAEELARKYNIELCFGDDYIAVEDDIFYIN